jgi:hypothetical protein
MLYDQAGLKNSPRSGSEEPAIRRDNLQLLNFGQLSGTRRKRKCTTRRPPPPHFRGILPCVDPAVIGAQDETCQLIPAVSVSPVPIGGFPTESTTEDLRPWRDAGLAFRYRSN